MPIGGKPPLLVREEHHVEDDVDAATTEDPLAEEVFEAAKWRLARDPECGTKMPNVTPERWLLHLLPVAEAKSPGLLVRYYRVKEIIVVDWVKFYDHDEDAAIKPEAYSID